MIFPLCFFLQNLPLISFKSGLHFLLFLFMHFRLCQYIYAPKYILFYMYNIINIHAFKSYDLLLINCYGKTKGPCSKTYSELTEQC